MKKTNSLLLLFTLTFLNLFSQDYITFPTGKFIQAKIIEVSTTEIKYKLYENSDQTIYTISRNLVYNLRYENGTFDMLNGIIIPGPNTSQPTANNVAAKSITAPQSQKAAVQAKAPALVTSTTKQTTADASTAANVQALSNQLSNLSPEQLKALQVLLNNQQTQAAQNAQANQQTVQTVQPVQAVQPQNVTSSINQVTQYALPTNQNTINKPTTNDAFKSKEILGLLFGFNSYNAFSVLLYTDDSVKNSDFGFGYEFGYLSSDISIGTENILVAGVRGTYHIPLSNWMDPYVGARVHVKYAPDAEQAGFGFDLLVGYRLLFGNLGLVVEYHGITDFLNLGLTLKL